MLNLKSSVLYNRSLHNDFDIFIKKKKKKKNLSKVLDHTQFTVDS